MVSAPEPRKRVAAGLRPLMYQIVFFVMIAGLLLALLNQLRRAERDDASLESQVPARVVPVVTGKPGAGPAGGEGGEGPAGGAGPAAGDAGPPTGGDVEDVEDVEFDPEAVRLAGLEDPAEPFIERRELAHEAAALEARREVSVAYVDHLLHRLRSPRSASDPVVLNDRDHEVWQELVDRPVAYRGKLVEFAGNLVVPRGGTAPELDAEILLPSPAASGVPHLYRSYIHGEEGKFFAVATWRESERSFVHGDGATVRGYFAQLYSYEYAPPGGGGLKLARIPLIIADDLEYVASPVPTSDYLLPLYYLVGGLTLLAALVIAVLSWRTHRVYRRREIARMEELKRRKKPPRNPSRPAEPAVPGDAGPSEGEA